MLLRPSYMQLFPFSCIILRIWIYTLRLCFQAEGANLLSILTLRLQSVRLLAQNLYLLTLLLTLGVLQVSSRGSPSPTHFISLHCPKFLGHSKTKRPSVPLGKPHVTSPRNRKPIRTYASSASRTQSSCTPSRPLHNFRTKKRPKAP